MGSFPRALECVELFAGVGAVAPAATELGFRGTTYDIKRIPGITDISADLSVFEGFRTATTLVMRLTIGALLWLALVCASSVIMHAAKCKRPNSNSYEGDCSYPQYAKKRGNTIAQAIVRLVLIAV